MSSAVSDTAMACEWCRDPIGPYERLVLPTTNGYAYATSLAAAPNAGSVGALYHGRCYALRARALGASALRAAAIRHAAARADDARVAPPPYRGRRGARSQLDRAGTVPIWRASSRGRAGLAS